MTADIIGGIVIASVLITVHQFTPLGAGVLALGLLLSELPTILRWIRRRWRTL